MVKIINAAYAISVQQIKMARKCLPKSAKPADNYTTLLCELTRAKKQLEYVIEVEKPDKVINRAKKQYFLLLKKAGEIASSTEVWASGDNKLLHLLQLAQAQNNLVIKVAYKPTIKRGKECYCASLVQPNIEVNRNSGRGNMIENSAWQKSTKEFLRDIHTSYISSLMTA